MAWTPTILDWRLRLCPSSQIFRAGGSAVMGGFLLGGASQMNPEPGGVARLSLEFPAFWPDRTLQADVSWTMDEIANGNILRIPLRASYQLVPQSEIFGTPATFTRTAAANPADPATDGDAIWDPKVPILTAAAKGASIVNVNLNGLAPVLFNGHVIGFRVGGLDFAHRIRSIDYADETATMTISPPLRRALTTSDFCYLRPSMLATCVNAEAAAGAQLKRSFQGLAPLEFVEALV